MILPNPSLFLDPTDGWRQIQTGAGHAYDIDADGVHRPYIELETTGSGVLYTVVSGQLSAKPHGYEGFPATQDLLNREEVENGGQRYDDEEQIDAIKNNPLVDQPLPEAVTLYLYPNRPVPMTDQLWNPIEVLASPNAIAFGYVDVDPETIPMWLGDHFDDAEFIADNSELEDELNDASVEQKVEMLLSGLIDVPVPVGTAIGQVAETASGTGTRSGGFTVFEDAGPSDPVRFFETLNARADVPQDNAANAATKLKEIAGQPTWPLYDETNKSAAMHETTQKTFPMAVLEDMRERHDLTPSEWRTVGNNQKALYRERLLERTGHGNGSVPPFEFEMLELKNVFQLEAISEFYVNHPEPQRPSETPRQPDSNLTGNEASIDDSYSPSESHVEESFEKIDLWGGQPIDLSDVRPNLDHLILWNDTNRPSRTYRIIDIDMPNQSVIVEGQPSLNAGTSDWEIQGYKTVDLLDPAGTNAQIEEFSSGSGHPTRRVKLNDAKPDRLRWLWLRSEARDIDRSDQPDTTTDTIEFEEDGPYKITGVKPEKKIVTVRGTPDFSGTKSWQINRRPSIVLVDPLGHRITGRRSSIPESSSTSVVKLEGPKPDLTRVNPNFDTIYFHDETNPQTYRIADVDNDNGTVTLHAPPSLPTDGSRWGICAGVGGELPPLYYLVGNSWRGYNHYDGMVFVVGGGSVRRSFRWTSYPSRNYAEGHQSKSASRGNMRYQYESWVSGSSFLNLSTVVADCLSKYYEYSTDQNGDRPWDELHADGTREAAWYFDNSPPPSDDRLSVDPTDPVPADRTPNDQPGPSTDGKTLVRLHWSPHYRENKGVRSAGCITSPIYPGLRRALLEYYQEEHNAMTGNRNEEVQNIIDNVSNQEDAENEYWSHDDAWRYTVVGDIWLIRPEQRPTEEGYS